MAHCRAPIVSGNIWLKHNLEYNKEISPTVRRDESQIGNTILKRDILK